LPSIDSGPDAAGIVNEAGLAKILAQQRSNTTTRLDCMRANLAYRAEIWRDLLEQSRARQQAVAWIAQSASMEQPQRGA
jgi:hypothetical protein